MSGDDPQSLIATQAETGSPGDAVPSGRVGRFVVLGTVGQGAMGIVLAAYDPDLDRKVAIKLVKPGSAGPRGRERTLREARAMAKLSHPNVLAIHEVGTIGDDVFIAAEFAGGGTLRAWCAEPRTWREIRDRFVQAGRGLEAAHRAGLVHRDFKPENVLLTGDGKVRVADFGLVGLEPSGAPDAPASTSITRTGAIIGTPAYMAPEQHRGATVGPAADQFAFCVSLWEALHGARPFAGETTSALAENVGAGRIVEPPAGRDVPDWLDGAVRRGLSVRAEDRWPSMTALVAALEHEPARPPRPRVAGALLAAGAAAAAGLAVYALSSGTTARDSRCSDMDRGLAGVWDPERAGDVRAAFRASERASADDTYVRVERILEDYTQRWVRARVDTCEATHVRGEQSEALLDLRMACLDRRLADVDALVDVFASRERDVLDVAVSAANKLPPLSACDDAEALRAPVPPPADPDARAEVDAIRRSLADAKALGDAAQYPEALALAQDAAARAAAVGDADVLAEALLRRGTLEGNTGDGAAAAATLEQALVEAAGARDDVLAANVWIEYIFVVGDLLGRPEDAVHLRPLGEAAIRRAGKAEPLLEARFLHAVGAALTAAWRGPEAIPYLERAIAAKEAVVGPDHPDVAATLNMLGNALQQDGKLPEAAAQYSRALAIWEKTLGPAHPNVGRALGNLGNGAQMLGKYEEARDYAQRALDIFVKAYGEDHPTVAIAHDGLSNAWHGMGNAEESLRHCELALAIRERVLEPDHLDIGYSLVNVGVFYLQVGRYTEAEAYYRRALPIYEKAYAADNAELAYPLTGLAEALVSLGRAKEALPHAERALTFRAGTPPDVPLTQAEYGQIRFILARILWELGDDRPRALSLAREARVLFVSADILGVDLLAQTDAWLAKHGR